jgi:membrane peptidoglycan carboxypeptidase
LEQNFEKHELLELYVNVVEFGPGIYGIRQAAEYYFSTSPDRLTPAQAFFLASLLPAPTRRHFEEDGRLSAGRADHVRRLLKISRAREGLTEGELEEALAEELVFGQARTLPENEETPSKTHGALDDDSVNSPSGFRKGASPKQTPSAVADDPIFPARSPEEP